MSSNRPVQSHHLTKGSGLRRGFSLIELLAAIAVVAILAAILIPAVSNVREKGLAAKGIAHLRQASGVLLLSAVQDANRITLVGRPGGAHRSWLFMLQSKGIIGDESYEGYRCPKQLPFGGGSHYHTFGVPMNRTMGEAIESHEGGNSRLLYLSRLENPADFMLLVDSVLSLNGYQWYTAWDSGEASGPHARHSGQINVGMADGSARSVSPTEYAELRAKMLGTPGLQVGYFNEALERVSASE
jgi:prepilin-type N-terminal cleavage/methylation domain-containing protein/prepilin-type processing-associated H-X9-DG protein